MTKWLLPSMLKAIELYGFKSFVDKTRFEFPPGITVIVGPNGSGKSNVVDAIKWVLGAQSAKSLRGKEMADVIFKGSGSGRRKPANSAEATIIFDNSERRFEWDADEVHVTRRVYRSGEGEYLINGQASRLKDIKDLFRGTGVGADAYSLIEQGKVDTVLQASPKERRAIFEEAAGISRFKAKKLETQRRLERVEQNLLRLSDIVDEVSGRLRRLKSQAGKAQRYQEYTSRLQSLRTQVGQVDWQRLSTELTTLESEMTEVNGEVEQHHEALRTAEQQMGQIEEQNGESLQQLRSLELASSRLRESIATHASVIESERQRGDELQEEGVRHRAQIVTLERRSDELQRELAELQRDLEAARHEHESSQQLRDQQQHELHQRTAALEQAKEVAEQNRQQFVEAMQASASLGTEISGHESSIETAQQALTRATDSLAQITAALREAQASLDEVSEREQAGTQRLDQLEHQLTSERAALEAADLELSEVTDATTGLKQREIALRERAGVLEEIESRMEGIGSGVKEVLQRVKDDPTGPLGGIRGMVADLLHVTEPALAELVDVALGERAQHLVVAGTRLFQHLEEDSLEVPGRVGFLRLQSTAPPATSVQRDLAGQQGVIGRAVEFVRATSEYDHLLSWLLGDTWFVETLADAIQLGRSIATPLRFVTRNGELLDRDGRLVVGPHSAALGLMSRRTELRELQERIDQSQQQLKNSEQRLTMVQSTQQAHQIRISELRQQRNQAAEVVSAARADLASAREKVKQLAQQETLSGQEKALHAQQIDQGKSQLADARSRLADFERQIKQLEQQLATSRDWIASEEEQLESFRVAASEAELSAARSEQQVAALETQLAQLRRDQAERLEGLELARNEAQRAAERQQLAELTVLRASAETAELAVQLEGQQLAVTQQSERLEQLRDQRQTAANETNGIRDALRQCEQRMHQAELESERIRNERDHLAARLQEDYGITIADLQRQLTPEEQEERDQVDTEIDELRRKLSQLGAVNMDALSELQELESRHTGLDEQYRDLVDAKEALEKIIHKIDADSRRLFTETLEAIRANFAVLFRKVFGGGRADIVLEEDVDILESGIDIVATPPGKQSLGLSLLSGGERALTAVTLLMAVFQYRPSPFCVLDEVDGPLDEANIGRFIDVLNEFLAWTKFVVVTHSKKTMTTAHTLYGVTMQESGVSKRVSVRFEEVGEHGEISESAIQRSSDDAA